MFFGFYETKITLFASTCTYKLIIFAAQTKAKIMKDFLKELGIENNNSGVSTGSAWLAGGGANLASYSPVDNLLVAHASSASAADYESVIQTAQAGFLAWRKWTAPARGEVVRQFGEELRKHKDALGKLVSYEMGKSLQEGLWRSARDDRYLRFCSGLI
jgi:delta 1-pyrroline-5-carboxylate dehydrogenase